MPPKKTLPVYDRVYQNLFDDKDKTKLSPNDFAVKERLQAVFTKKLSHPTIGDRSLVNFIMESFGISMAMAYHDISAVERIIGNVRKSNKEHIRIIVTENMKQVIDIELARINQGMTRDDNGKVTNYGDYSTKELIMALATLARVNNLEKEAPDMPNWSELQPPVIEPTDDVTLLDLEDIPDEQVLSIRERYLGRQKLLQQRNDETA